MTSIPHSCFLSPSPSPPPNLRSFHSLSSPVKRNTHMTSRGSIVPEISMSLFFFALAISWYEKSEGKKARIWHRYIPPLAILPSLLWSSFLSLLLCSVGSCCPWSCTLETNPPPRVAAIFFNDSCTFSRVRKKNGFPKTMTMARANFVDPWKSSITIKSQRRHPALLKE